LCKQLGARRPRISLRFIAAWVLAEADRVHVRFPVARTIVPVVEGAHVRFPERCVRGRAERQIGP
jgi:hypothetical protein